MTPSQKAAAILALAGEENAAKLIFNIPEFEVKKILRAMNRLPTLTEQDIDKIAKEFLEIIKKIDSYRGKFSLEKAKKILLTANQTIKDPKWIETLSDSYLIEEIRNILNNLPNKTLSQWLKQEHPQTITLILSIATSDKANAIFKFLQENVRCEILLRMSQLNHVDTPELENIYEELSKYQKNVNPKALDSDGIEKIKQMLQATDPAFSTKLLDGIKEKDSNLAQRLQQELLTLSKLSELNQNHMAVLCAHLPDQTLALALRLEPNEIKDKFLCNVAKKRRHLIESEWEGGKVQKKEVDTAIAALIQKALELKENGKIVFPWEETLV